MAVPDNAGGFITNRCRWWHRRRPCIMTAPKYRARVDKNQKEIVDALKKIGCTVETIGTPVDLLVGYRARNFLLECKNPQTDYGRNDRSTTTQRKFFAHWQGQVRKVSSPEEAIEVVTNAYRST